MGGGTHEPIEDGIELLPALLPNVHAQPLHALRLEAMPARSIWREEVMRPRTGSPGVFARGGEPQSRCRCGTGLTGD